jgi:hypothetical protein
MLRRELDVLILTRAARSYISLYCDRLGVWPCICTHGKVMTSALMARGSTAAPANPLGVGAKAADDPQGPSATFGEEIDRAVADKRPPPQGKKDPETRTSTTGASPDTRKADDKDRSPKNDPVVTTLWLPVTPDQQRAVALPFSLAFAAQAIAGQTDGGELGSVSGGPSGGGGSAIMPKAPPQTGVAGSASGVDAIPEQPEAPQQALAFGVKMTVVNPLGDPSPQAGKPAASQGQPANQSQLAADQMAAPEQAAARGQIAAPSKTKIDVPVQHGHTADPDGSTHSEPAELRVPEPGPSPGAAAVNYADVAAAIDTKSQARPKEAENVAPLERSSEVETSVGPASPQARDFTVRIAGPDQLEATLRIRDAGADVRVAVHTPNLDLTKSLRTELDGLVGRLEANGLKPQVWQPAQSSASDNSSGRDRSEAGDPNHLPRNSRGWQGESDQNQDNRHRSWIEEMEEKYGYH